jgi:hypothetical protein
MKVGLNVRSLPDRLIRFEMKRSSFAFILSGGVDRFTSRSFALAFAPAACHDLFRTAMASIERWVR